MSGLTARRNDSGADRSSLDLYLKEIQRYPLLSRKEENDLARRTREGDQLAREKLIRSNLRFVVSIAKRYAGHGVPLEDLINDGNFGLVKAAERFDPERGFKFISYAVWWIRQSIMQSVSNNSRLIRLPMNRVALAQQATRAARELEQDLGREPSAEEIAKELSVKEEEVREVITFSRSHLSVDETVGGDGDETTFVEQIEDESATSPDAGLYAEMLGRDLEDALESLTERERVILSTYYGLGGRTPKTLEQIGHDLGYTRERIRQLKEQAIEKLRARSGVTQIADYLE
jgi:RNA polymerase primary sigma factor